MKSSGANVYRIRTPPKREPLRYLIETRSLFRKISSRYHILHSHVPIYGTIFGCWAARFGIPIRIAHAHASDVDRLADAVKLSSVLPLHRCVHTHFAACSPPAARYFFGRCSRVHIIRNAVDIRRYAFWPAGRDSVRRELGLDGRFVLGHTGRFVVQKNHEFLIALFAAVCTRVPNSALLLVGDGPGVPQAKQRAEELGILHKVHFAGRRCDIGAVLSACDVFVFPSLWEAFPFSALEAQINGLPCIVSRAVPNDVWLTDLVRPMDLALGLATWVEAVLEARSQRDTTGQIRGALRPFDVRQSIGEVESFYDELVCQSAAADRPALRALLQ